MVEFIFMLTQRDQTVPDALAVYTQLRETGLRYVGFKDVGLPEAELKRLADAIRADDRQVVLEVVSIDRAAELASVRAGLRIGVDILMGGTHPDAVLPLLAGQGVRYFPFPGRVVGHPSILEGSIEEIAAHAAALCARTGVHGLDLLAYRHAGDVPALIRAVVDAAECPVVAAGSIDSSARIRTVTEQGAWGFTIGSAIFDGSYLPGASTREAVEAVLADARIAAGASQSA